MCASIMTGNRSDNRFGGERDSSSCPAFTPEVAPMVFAHRRRGFAYSSLLSTGTPYAEQADRRENRLDGALLNAWGRVSAYLFSGMRHRQFNRLVQHAENWETQLTVLSDGGLRQAADELRGRLYQASECMTLWALNEAAGAAVEGRSQSLPPV